MKKQIVILFTFLLLSVSVYKLSGQNIWQIGNYSSERISSYDRSGKNSDGDSKNPMQPGETRVIAEVDGPGIIKHIWITIGSLEPQHLKKIVIRMYWDNEESPSVEAPIGDFFGLGLGRYVSYESKFLSVASQRALNCSFEMPFRKSARITVTNEGFMEILAFYYNIDWEKHNSLPENTAYFHAQYRQATPTKGWTDDWTLNSDSIIINKVNKTGENNYVILEANGRGHYLGVTHSIVQNQGDWWGEGDEMIFIDGAEQPQIHGTGSEDYYLGAFCYGGCGLNVLGGTNKEEFSYSEYGNPVNGGDNRGALWTVYRYHSESPIVFNKSIRVTMEHGHANHRSDNYYTVAFWYQIEPHATFPPLPEVESRILKSSNTGGPTIGREF